MQLRVLLLCALAVGLVNITAAHSRRDCGSDDARRADGHRRHGDRVDHGVSQRNNYRQEFEHDGEHAQSQEREYQWKKLASQEHEVCRENYATCHVQPNLRVGAQNASNITGDIRLQRLSGNRVKILFDLHGFRSRGMSHAVHVHEFGDLSNGCQSLGSHFNPYNMKHGSHAGDLGNIRSGPDGSVHETLTQVQLRHHSIIGRSIVIHENEDDLDNPGSVVHGNTGQRLACCVIGVSSGTGWPSAHRSSPTGDREQAGGPQQSRRE